MKHESLVEAAGITLTLLFQYITSNGTKLIIHFPMEQMGSNCTQILACSILDTNIIVEMATFSSLVEQNLPVKSQHTSATPKSLQQPPQGQVLPLDME